jgi:hypothetical protein
LTENNAGGILLSDDTGATHDNLIIGNIAQNNPFDCGITLASHPLDPNLPPEIPPTAASTTTLSPETSRRVTALPFLEPAPASASSSPAAGWRLPATSSSTTS